MLLLFESKAVLKEQSLSEQEMICILTELLTLHDGLEWKCVLRKNLISVVHDEAEEGETWNVHLETNHLVPDRIVT